MSDSTPRKEVARDCLERGAPTHQPWAENRPMSCQVAFPVRIPKVGSPISQETVRFWFVHQSLRAALSTRDNALNFVRLVLASSVIFGHSWPIGDFGDSHFPVITEWAVNGFFAISGYLIAGSRLRLSFADFMVNRALRLFPAFWTVLIVTAFVLAPMSVMVSGGQYDILSATLYVLRNAGLYMFQWGIEGSLLDVPLSGVWNGSLWTLFYEFVAYIAAGILLTLPWLRKHLVLTTSVATVAAMGAQIAALGVLDVTTNILLNSLRLGAFFAAGMLVYALGDRLPLSWWPAVTAFLALAVLTATGTVEQFGQVPFAFLLLWLGARAPIRIGARNDISYGVYIWAFPVQQLIVLVGLAWLGPWGTAILAFTLTVPLAWLSWRYVEKPSMALRKRLTRAERATKAAPRA